MILGFKDVLVPAIVAGTKLHTLRVGDRWRAGMPIQYYARARQPGMYKIREDGVCTAVQKMEIYALHRLPLAG